MRILFHVLFAALSLGVAGCTAHSMVIFFRDPTKFHELNSSRYREGRRQRWLKGAYIIAIFLGFGIAVYAAATSFLSWMPESWVRITEDGEREWIGHGIAMFAALFGSVGIVSGMSSVAADMAEKIRRIKLLTDEIERLKSARWDK